MKTAIVRLLIVLILCTVTKFAAAGDFVSVVIQTGQMLPEPITVPPDRFLIIRNFTQDTSTLPRGVVKITSNGSTNVIVMTATIVDPNAMSLEPINNVVIAGPATVNATCQATGTNCFITYRKGTD